MIVRRRFVLLLLEELLESALLIVAALEDEGEMRGRLRVGDGAAIELGASEAMHVAAEWDAIRIVNGLRDTRGDARRLSSLRGVAVGSRLRLCRSAQRCKRQQECGENDGSTQIGPDVLHESAHIWISSLSQPRSVFNFDEP